ncbi:MAG: hypothetical protein IT232_07190, partial [Flavobacteriales bacterium]|nr:hypothetical protein [Flavobacteriales bacterium]
MKPFLIKHTIILSLLFLTSVNKNLFAQNLVRNPSFEDIYSCPTTSLLDNHVKDWFGFNTTRYFNSCATTAYGTPNNPYGFQVARTGGGYALLYGYPWSYDKNRRSYIQCRLNDTLTKNQIYCVQYFVNLCDNAGGTIKEIDAFLSTDSIYWNNGISRVINGITPQIKSQQLLNDSINWILVSGLYKAKGGEQFIIIGNFNIDENTTVLSFKPLGEPIRIDYYIDDVSVTPFNIAPPNLGNDTILCANTPFTLTAPTGYDAYLWSNGTTNNTLAVIDSGTYWVKCIANGCGEITDTIHIGYYSIPTLKLPNDTILCLGNSINIEAQQGFNTYNWNTGATTANITVIDSGLYILNVTSFCGTQTDSVYIGLDSLPTYTILIGNDTNICHEGKNVSVTLFADTLLPNYFWNTGATTDSLVINTEGLYWLTTSYFCGNINSNTVAIEQCPKDS